MVKEIPITRGKVALVDDEDYERVNQWKWYATVRPNGNCYAARTIGGHRRHDGIIYMHSFIMNTPSGMATDHINRNGLDNRRCNLRICTNRQNHFNRALGSTNRSGYKGVYFRKDTRKWAAMLMLNKKHVCLGTFADPHSAARAYDAAAVKYFGEFAFLNFPKELNGESINQEI